MTPLPHTGIKIHYVVFYEEDPDNAASGFDAGAFVPCGKLAQLWTTYVAMRSSRPMATICIRPVTEPPEWVTWE